MNNDLKTYLISYDLQKAADYTNLYDSIKTAEGWWHYLESLWIITSKLELNYWRDKINKSIGKDDTFIIIEIEKGKTDGWLPKEAWKWIKNNTSIS